MSYCEVTEDNSEKISYEIEKVRKHMVHLGTRFGLDHPDVQRCSELLDLLLLEYYAARKLKKQL